MNHWIRRDILRGGQRTRTVYGVLLSAQWGESVSINDLSSGQVQLAIRRILINKHDDE